MKWFNELVHTIDRLLSPTGCPWDREQTLASMRHSLIEETAEVIEAIDLQEAQAIEEELGDLCFNVLFLCRLAEKEGHCSMEDVFRHINAKLIRRHPHVFGQADIQNAEQVQQQWDDIKKKEKIERRHFLDGIPQTLPTLSRAQKIVKKMKKANMSLPSLEIEKQDKEEKIGQALLDVIIKAQMEGVDAELSLRRVLRQLEQGIRG